MDPKSTVVKSKSSNSAISKKSEEESRRQCNKKTRSSANFPSHGLKKRGVYVEKRLTKTNLVNNDKEVESIAQKPPPRPKPGQKKFLASVLNILSKSTAGTQYPELQEYTRECKSREKDKNKATSKQKNTSNEDRALNYSINAKEKFKSRVLNKKYVREDKKKMVVLQSKKEIAQTPSNYSEWSYKDTTQNSNVSNFMIYEDANNGGGLNIDDELKNAVLQGRNLKEQKCRYLEDEPKTLVSDAPKVQKNLYNFFVDLLETTISVYNVKTEYDATAHSDVSRSNLQINESVANKLNIGKIKRMVEFDDGIISPECHNLTQNDTEPRRNFLRAQTNTLSVEPLNREESPKTPKVRKVRRNVFLYSNPLKTVPPKSRSAEISRKTIFRNKNDLINVLKQELEVDTYKVDEPRSIFQALRVMARNKKKITFDPVMDNKFFTEECVLKRRNVISSRRVKKTNKNTIKNVGRAVKPFKYTDYLRNSKTLDKEDNKGKSGTYTESYHSLEVYGFDYEEQGPKMPTYRNISQGASLTYHSSASNSELDFDVQDTILNPTSTCSSIRKFMAVVD